MKQTIDSNHLTDALVVGTVSPVTTLDPITFTHSAHEIFNLLLEHAHVPDEKMLQIVDEVFYLFNYEPGRIILIFNHILTETWGYFTGAFPWLPLLEEKRSASQAELTTLVSLQNYFLDQLLQLEHIVLKYGLHEQNSLIKLACDYLLEHIDESPSMDIITYTLCINKDYFGKLFKQKTGIYFKEFAYKIKMEYAKKLLTETHLKNYEICERLGYCTPDYFTRLFKNYTGMTPMQFKKTASRFNH